MTADGCTEKRNRKTTQTVSDCLYQRSQPMWQNEISARLKLKQCWSAAIYWTYFGANPVLGREFLMVAFVHLLTGLWHNHFACFTECFSLPHPPNVGIYNCYLGLQVVH